MDELISREALKKAFENLASDDYNEPIWYQQTVFETIDNAPTVELTEEQAIDKLHETGWMQNHDKELTEQPTDEKAEWIYCGVWSEGVGMGQVYGDKVKCSNCMTEYRFKHRFCPYCGRRMKNGKL